MLRFWKKPSNEPVIFHCKECKIPVTIPLQRFNRHAPHCHIFQKERLTQNAIIQPNYYFENEDGNYFLNNQDKQFTQFKEGIKKGCCGVPATPNDLNLQCILGHTIGTECSECYMMQFVLLDENHVSSQIKDETGIYALLNHDFLLYSPNHLKYRSKILLDLQYQPKIAFEQLTHWIYDAQHDGSIPKDIIELLHTSNDELKKRIKRGEILDKK
jgi:hypothetical protein